MDKTKSTPGSASKASVSLKDEVTEIADHSGIGTPWVRADGAVCFGNECVVINREKDGQLRMEIHPDECGAESSAALLGHIVATGKGVHIVIPASGVKND